MEGRVDQKNRVVEKIFALMDPAILKSFSQEQLTALRASIDQVLPQRTKHLLDVRGVIPLLFGRFYFVISSGKDQRKKPEKDAPFDLRAKTLVRDVMTFLVIVAFTLGIFGYLIIKIYLLAVQRGMVS